MLTFEWLNGCASDRMIEVFKKNRIAWERDHYFRICADISKTGKAAPVDYRHIDGRTFEIIEKYQQ